MELNNGTPWGNTPVEIKENIFSYCEEKDFATLSLVDQHTHNIIKSFRALLSSSVSKILAPLDSQFTFLKNNPTKLYIELSNFFKIQQENIQALLTPGEKELHPLRQIQVASKKADEKVSVLVSILNSPFRSSSKNIFSQWIRETYPTIPSPFGKYLFLKSNFLDRSFCKVSSNEKELQETKKRKRLLLPNAPDKSIRMFYDRNFYQTDLAFYKAQTAKYQDLTDLKILIRRGGENELKVIKEIIEYGCDILRPELGLLHTAVECKQIKFVNFFLSKGFDVNGLSKVSKKKKAFEEEVYYTPLHILALTFTKLTAKQPKKKAQFKEIFQTLIEYGADPYLPDSEGNTLLHLFIKFNTFLRIGEGILKLSELIPDFKFDVTTPNKQGNTILHYACHYFFYKNLKESANNQIQNHQHLFVNESFDVIFEFGNSVLANISNNEGKTPLQVFIEKVTNPNSKLFNEFFYDNIIFYFTYTLFQKCFGDTLMQLFVYEENAVKLTQSVSGLTQKVLNNLVSITSDKYSLLKSLNYVLLIAEEEIKEEKKRIDEKKSYSPAYEERSFILEYMRQKLDTLMGQSL